LEKELNESLQKYTTSNEKVDQLKTATQDLENQLRQLQAEMINKERGFKLEIEALRSQLEAKGSSLFDAEGETSEDKDSEIARLKQSISQLQKESENNLLFDELSQSMQNMQRQISEKDKTIQFVMKEREEVEKELDELKKGPQSQ
jgi:chromosome segregation ATPase